MVKFMKHVASLPASSQNTFCKNQGQGLSDCLLFFAFVSTFLGLLGTKCTTDPGLHSRASEEHGPELLVLCLCVFSPTTGALSPSVGEEGHEIQAHLVRKTRSKPLTLAYKAFGPLSPTHLSSFISSPLSHWAAAALVSSLSLSQWHVYNHCLSSQRLFPWPNPGAAFLTPQASNQTSPWHAGLP